MLSNLYLSITLQSRMCAWCGCND